MPIKASAGAKDSGFSSRSSNWSPLTPIRLISQAVTVVPIFDPMMTPTVLAIRIRPELTRPTSITVTAEELCTAMVTTQPKTRPAKRFFVMLWIMRSIREPAIFFRLSDIWFMP